MYCMKYEEFSTLKEEIDPRFPFCKRFLYCEGDFFIEPTFYTQLMGLKDQHPKSFEIIIKEIYEVVKKYRHVIFTGDYESPQVEIDGYIYRELFDMTDKHRILIDDNSRGSDYGD